MNHDKKGKIVSQFQDNQFIDAVNGLKMSSTGDIAAEVCGLRQEINKMSTFKNMYTKVLAKRLTEATTKPIGGCEI